MTAPVYVVALSARPTLRPPEYVPANCAVCRRDLLTSPAVREVAEKHNASVACVICALSGLRPLLGEEPR